MYAIRSYYAEFLVGAGCVAIWESCWVGHELYGKYGANVSRRVGRKELLVEDYSHSEMTFRMAAAAAGMPFAVSQSSLGTDIHNPQYDVLGRAGLRDGSRTGIARSKYRFVITSYSIHYTKLYDAGRCWRRVGGCGFDGNCAVRAKCLSGQQN